MYSIIEKIVDEGPHLLDRVRASSMVCGPWIRGIRDSSRPVEGWAL